MSLPLTSLFHGGFIDLPSFFFGLWVDNGIFPTQEPRAVIVLLRRVSLVWARRSGGLPPSSPVFRHGCAAGGSSH